MSGLPAGCELRRSSCWRLCCGRRLMPGGLDPMYRSSHGTRVCIHYEEQQAVHDVCGTKCRGIIIGTDQSAHGVDGTVDTSKSQDRFRGGGVRRDMTGKQTNTWQAPPPAFSWSLPLSLSMGPPSDERPREDEEGGVGGEAQGGHENDGVAARLEAAAQEAVLVLCGEELALALVAAVDGDEQDGDAVGGEEGANGVELLGEDLEDDEGEGELPESGAHVGALEGALRGADLDEPACQGSTMSDPDLSLCNVRCCCCCCCCCCLHKGTRAVSKARDGPAGVSCLGDPPRLQPDWGLVPRTDGWTTHSSDVSTTDRALCSRRCKCSSGCAYTPTTHMSQPVSERSSQCSSHVHLEQKVIYDVCPTAAV